MPLSLRESARLEWRADRSINRPGAQEEVMAFLKLVIAMLFMAALLVFGLENVQERVRVDLRPLAEYRDVSLSLVLFYAYFAGLFTYAVVSVLRDLRLRAEIARLARDNRRLSDELHALRSATLDDLPIEDEA